MTTHRLNSPVRFRMRGVRWVLELRQGRDSKGRYVVVVYENALQEFTGEYSRQPDSETYRVKVRSFKQFLNL